MLLHPNSFKFPITETANMSNSITSNEKKVPKIQKNRTNHKRTSSKVPLTCVIHCLAKSQQWNLPVMGPGCVWPLVGTQMVVHLEPGDPQVLQLGSAAWVSTFSFLSGFPLLFDMEAYSDLLLCLKRISKHQTDHI